MIVLLGVFALGVFVGGMSVIFIHRSKSIGSLRIDESDPDDGPYLFLELSSDPSVIKTKKYVTLKINIKNIISQK